ncbi:MAG: plastocyanin/azurin family copper-binding protein [bacterium]|nr:plastocyanin/azurin family copper-binding protein [bacterium]
MEPKNESTKYIVGIVIIALVIIGVSLMGRNKKLSDTKSAAPEKEVAGQISDTTTTDSKDTKITSITPEGKTTEVNYTSANGFTPDTLSIKVGDTVKFVNKSPERMWVGSDIHPTHMNYDGTSLKQHCGTTPSPSFDQCASGSEYSFTFTKAGSWNYHNHPRATMKGVVVVK